MTDYKFGTWYPIEILDKKKPHFVLVYENGAQRLHFWNSNRQRWESPNNSGLDECYNPSHFMRLPPPPEEKITMEFLPKEICLKLLGMGCKSQCGFGYDSTGHIRKLPNDSIAGLALDEFGPYTTAFTPWDFVGTSKQARENARILWGEESVDSLGTTESQWREEVNAGHIKSGFASGEESYSYHRHACIDAEDAVKYICDAVERVKL